MAIFLVVCLLPMRQASEEATRNFSLFDTSGTYVSLSDYKGQYVVLNFWAIWCDTWKEELPSLLTLTSDEEQDHFQLLAISVDGARLPVFERDTAGRQIPFPVLLDPGSTVSRSYKIAHVSTVIILDRSGRVHYSTYGYPGNHVLFSALRRIENPAVWLEKSDEVRWHGRTRPPTWIKIRVKDFLTLPA
jgi:peroxiredoxin